MVSGGIEELRVIVLDFNYINQLSLLPILNSIPKNSLHAITGNMLGDGWLSLSRPDKGKGKFSMTMDIYSLNYLHHLDPSIYNQLTETKIYPYPNLLPAPQLSIKEKKYPIIILKLELILYILLYIVFGIKKMMRQTSLLKLYLIILKKCSQNYL